MWEKKKKLLVLLSLVVFIGVFLAQIHIVSAFYSNYIVPLIHWGYITITDLH